VLQEEAEGKAFHDDSADHLQSNHFAIAMHAAQTSLISNHCWLISGSLMKLIVFCIDATALMPSSFQLSRIEPGDDIH